MEKASFFTDWIICLLCAVSHGKMTRAWFSLWPCLFIWLVVFVSWTSGDGSLCWRSRGRFLPSWPLIRIQPDIDLNQRCLNHMLRDEEECRVGLIQVFQSWCFQCKATHSLYLAYSCAHSNKDDHFYVRKSNPKLSIFFNPCIASLHSGMVCSMASEPSLNKAGICCGGLTPELEVTAGW